MFILGGTKILSKLGTTQSDPVLMAIYGIGVTPLINMLISILINKYLFKLDFSAAGGLKDLRI